MRLLLISHFFPPETHGGTQTFVAALARHRQARGDRVQVLAGSRRIDPAGGEESRIDDGVAVLRLFRRPDELHSGDLGSERILARIEQEARDFQADMVHVHHWHALSAGMVKRLGEAGFRVALTLHDLYSTCARFFRMPDARRHCGPETTFLDCGACLAPDLPALDPTALEAGLARRFATFMEEIRKAAVVSCVSEDQRRRLAAIPGFDASRILVTPIGVAVPPAPPRPPLEPGLIRIVNWAGLDPRKGVEVLIDAIAGSVHRDRFRLTLHGRSGEPTFMRELEERARGLDVRFAGPFEDKELPRIAAAADLAVFPFLAHETHGLVVDEALQLGLPVLVSDAGAPPERLGSQGLVCPRGDVAALRNRLEELLSNPGKLAELARGHHRALSLEAALAAQEVLYRGIDGV